MTDEAQVVAEGPHPGTPLSRVLTWARFELLELAFVITAVVDDRGPGSTWFAWLLSLTAATAALRIWWQRQPRSRPALITCFVLNLASPWGCWS